MHTSQYHYNEHTHVSEVRFVDLSDPVEAGVEVSGIFGKRRYIQQPRIITVHRSHQAGTQHTGGHTLRRF